MGFRSIGVLFLGLVTALTAFGQEFSWSDLGKQVQYLEQRVGVLEGQMYNLNMRVLQLENGGYNPIPPVQFVANCMIVDSGYSKTFLGSGKTNLDAEIAARKSCESSVHASYCNQNAKIKCDNTAQVGGSGAICLVVDSGFGKSFRGEGKTPVEAEARAKMSCQNSVNASYCGSVNARCETVPFN